MQIRQSLLAASCAAAALLLSGCGLFQDPPPPPAPKVPLIVTHAGTIDPVHVRDPSVSHQEENRGGAALRADEWHQVLWAAHYEGESKCGREAIAPDLQKMKAASPKTPSGKDASVYAEQKKDASVYAEKSAPASGTLTIGGHRLAVTMYDGKTFFWQDPKTRTSWIGAVGADRIRLFRLDDADSHIAVLLETANAGHSLGSEGGKPVLSRSIRMKFDCTNASYSTVQGAAYSGYFGKGRLLGGFASDNARSSADETLQRMMAAACAVQHP